MLIYNLLLALHVCICIFLILVILLQAGRGGGLTEDLGGGAQSVLGTQAPAILKKATAVGAISFIVLTLLLAVITAHRGRSLFTGARPQGIPAMPAATGEVPQETGTPAAPGETPAPESSPDTAPLAPEDFPIE